MIDLENKSRRLQVFVLCHDEYCAALGVCACEIDPGTSRRLPKSVTLETRGIAQALSEAVLAVAKVREAARAGLVVVHHRVAPAARDETPTTPETPGAKKKRG